MIWKKAKVDPAKQNYLRTGQGMGQTLQVANEKSSYVLADRATYLALKSRLKFLKVLLTKKEAQKNIYSVVELNPKKLKFKQDKARELSAWLLKDTTLDLIADFGENDYGESLFTTMRQIR